MHVIVERREDNQLLYALGANSLHCGEELVLHVLVHADTRVRQVSIGQSFDHEPINDR